MKPIAALLLSLLTVTAQANYCVANYDTGVTRTLWHSINMEGSSIYQPMRTSDIDQDGYSEVLFTFLNGFDQKRVAAFEFTPDGTQMLCEGELGWSSFIALDNQQTIMSDDEKLILVDHLSGEQIHTVSETHRLNKNGMIEKIDINNDGVDELLHYSTAMFDIYELPSFQPLFSSDLQFTNFALGRFWQTDRVEMLSNDGSRWQFVEDDWIQISLPTADISQGNLLTLNKDAHDLVIGIQNSRDIVVIDYVNNTFETVVSADSDLQRLQWTDFNQDGQQELLAIDSSNKKIWFINPNTWQYEVLTAPENENFPLTVHLVDSDNDDKPDLVKSHKPEGEENYVITAFDLHDQSQKQNRLVKTTFSYASDFAQLDSDAAPEWYELGGDGEDFQLSAFDDNGEILWQIPAFQIQKFRASTIAFDRNQDGIEDIWLPASIYGNFLGYRIFDGSSGKELPSFGTNEMNMLSISKGDIYNTGNSQLIYSTPTGINVIAADWQTTFYPTDTAFLQVRLANLDDDATLEVYSDDNIFDLETASHSRISNLDDVQYSYFDGEYFHLARRGSYSLASHTTNEVLKTIDSCDRLQQSSVISSLDGTVFLSCDFRLKYLTPDMDAFEEIYTGLHVDRETGNYFNIQGSKMLARHTGTFVLELEGKFGIEIEDQWLTTVHNQALDFTIPVPEGVEIIDSWIYQDTGLGSVEPINSQLATYRYTPLGNSIARVIFSIMLDTDQGRSNAIKVFIDPTNRAPILENFEVDLHWRSSGEIVPDINDADGDSASIARFRDNIPYPVLDARLVPFTRKGILYEFNDPELICQSQECNIYVQVSDGISTNYNEAIITINSSNNAPIAPDQTINLMGLNTATAQLLGYDPDGDPITFELTTSVNSGTLSLDSQSGEVTYQSNEQNTQDWFEYTVSDGINMSLGFVNIVDIEPTATLPVSPSPTVTITVTSIATANITAQPTAMQTATPSITISPTVTSTITSTPTTAVPSVTTTSTIYPQHSVTSTAGGFTTFWLLVLALIAPARRQVTKPN